MENQAWSNLNKIYTLFQTFLWQVYEVQMSFSCFTVFNDADYIDAGTSEGPRRGFFASLYLNKAYVVCMPPYIWRWGRRGANPRALCYTKQYARHVMGYSEF